VAPQRGMKNFLDAAAEVFLGKRRLCAGEEGKHGCEQTVQILR
jgi:hypothetical protein